MRRQEAKEALYSARKSRPGYLAFALEEFLSPENDYASIGTTREEVAGFMHAAIARWLQEEVLQHRLLEIRQAIHHGYTAEELGLDPDDVDRAVVLAGREDDYFVWEMTDRETPVFARYVALSRIADQVDKGLTSAAELGLDPAGIQIAYDDLMEDVVGLCRQGDPDALDLLSRETDPTRVLAVAGVEPVSAESLEIPPHEFDELVAKAESYADLKMAIEDVEEY